MRIQAAPQRREVQQFQTHSHYDPRNHKARPHCPRPARLPVLIEAEPAPHQVLYDANHDVGRHVVRVVPRVPFQVRDVRDEQGYAEERPGAQNGLRLPPSQIQAEDADQSVVQTIQDACAGSEIVQLLREAEIPGVEEHAEYPAGHAEVCQLDVVLAQRVGGRDVGDDFRVAVVVREEVEDGEEDGEGLLHSEEAVEGPFAVELHDRFRGRDALVGNYVLAGVVAFCWAVPEEELV